MFQAKSVLPGSIFILDNSSTHHCSVFLDAIIAIGCAYVFLPAYSPDFNAIGSPLLITLFFVACLQCALAEEAWHTLKDGVRAEQERMGADVCTDPYVLIEAGVNACTIGKCISWISHAGYKV